MRTKNKTDKNNCSNKISQVMCARTGAVCQIDEHDRIFESCLYRFSVAVQSQFCS